MDKNLYDLEPIVSKGTRFYERCFTSTKDLALKEMSDDELKETAKNLAKEIEELQDQIDTKENNSLKSDRYSVYNIKERLKNNEDQIKMITEELSNRAYDKKIKDMTDKEAKENAAVGQMLPQIPITGPILRKEI